MRGLLRDKRSQTLAWTLAMLGAVIILSPSSSLALTSNDARVTQGPDISGDFIDKSVTPTISQVFVKNDLSATPIYAQIDILYDNDNIEVCSGITSSIVQGAGAIIPDYPIDTTEPGISHIYVAFNTSSSTGSGNDGTCFNGGSKFINLYSYDNNNQITIGLPQGSSSIQLMTSSTDAIIGNVFNQIYLLGWFFFFFIVFWITFKIIKR